VSAETRSADYLQGWAEALEYTAKFPKVRDLLGDVALQAAFTGTEWAELPALVAKLRADRELVLSLCKRDVGSDRAAYQLAYDIIRALESP
jgi:hypothetical protein